MCVQKATGVVTVLALALGVSILSCDIFRRPDRAHLFPVVREYGTTQELWGYINQEGQLAIGFQFKSVHDFSEDVAAVRSAGESTGYIDRNGTWVIAPTYFDAYGFHEGRAIVWSYDGGYGAIDRSGRLIVPLEHRDLSNYSCGRAPYRGSSGWGYLALDGSIAIPADPRFQHAFTFSEGLARVVDAQYRNAVIDTTGALVIPFGRGSAGPFSESLAVFQDSGTLLCGYIDRTGAIAIAAQFERCGDFSEGVAAVMTSDGYGYIDHSGAWAITPRFEWAGEFSEGLAQFLVDTLSGYIDHAGNTRIEPKYAYGGQFHEGLAPVEGFNYIDTLGRYVWRQ